MIEHIKIEKLWGQYDIDWDPRLDVNILVGINGSGKSTLLRALDIALSSSNNVNSDEINTMYRWLDTVRIQGSDIDVHLISAVSRHNEVRWEVKCRYALENSFDSISYYKKVKESELSPLAARLDSIIFDTQKWSLNSFRLRATETPEEGIRISERLMQWLQIVNSFFATTQKTLTIHSNDVFFMKSDGTKIALNQLSAGEKQLLILLTNALIQDSEPFILMMDEPELSLDIDWQYKLIDTIRTLNPQCQIIIATHSPAIFGDGWNDKLFFMEDLLKKTDNA
jgi:predicted ATPase